MSTTSRTIEKVVPATSNGGPIQRLIGTVDVDGKGTLHALEDCDPCMLLDQVTIAKDGMPTFGAHPHRGHSVVTVLMQGQMTSWDSMNDEETTITGPSSYWVNAASGIFHDEISVIPDESDPKQHAVVFQLWAGVKEADRLEAPSLSFARDLPTHKILSNSGAEIGTIIDYVGGSSSDLLNIPRPLRVAQISQKAGTTYRFPIPSGHSGFFVNLSGASFVQSNSKPASFGGTKPTQPNDVLVLSATSTTSSDELSVMEIQTDSNAPSDYLACVGEPHGSPWYKKLVASGAVIAKTPEQAREIAIQIEASSKKGKETGDYTPFGRTPGPGGEGEF